jgi:hypothetical protein
MLEKTLTRISGEESALVYPSSFWRLRPRFLEPMSSPCIGAQSQSVRNAYDRSW